MWNSRFQLTLPNYADQGIRNRKTMEKSDWRNNVRPSPRSKKGSANVQKIYSKL